MEELNGLLAGALCSLAEGLIGEAAPAVDTVAEEARALLARAARLTPNSPEPLQVRFTALSRSASARTHRSALPTQALAGLLAEQGHADEALALLHQSLALWLPPAAEEAADGEREERFSAELPSLEFRFDTAKLLLDLDHSTDTAVRVLEARASRQRARLRLRAGCAADALAHTQGLLEECDDRPDVWHLLALAHHGACSFERARNCLDEAEEVRPRLHTRRRDCIALTRVLAPRSCWARCLLRTGSGWRASWCSCAQQSTPARRRGRRSAARMQRRKRMRQSPQTSIDAAMHCGCVRCERRRVMDSVGPASRSKAEHPRAQHTAHMNCPRQVKSRCVKGPR